GGAGKIHTAPRRIFADEERIGIADDLAQKILRHYGVLIVLGPGIALLPDFEAHAQARKQPGDQEREQREGDQQLDQREAGFAVTSRGRPPPPWGGGGGGGGQVTLDETPLPPHPTCFASRPLPTGERWSKLLDLALSPPAAYHSSRRLPRSEAQRRER